MSRRQKPIAAEKDLISLVIDGDYQKAKDAVFLMDQNYQLNFNELIYPLGQSRPGINKQYSEFTVLEVVAARGNWNFILWMLYVLSFIQKDYNLSSDQRQQLQVLTSRLLVHAAVANKPDIVSELLAKGADPNLVMIKGEKDVDTKALDWAIKHGSFEMARALMAAGADPLEVNNTSLVANKISPLKAAVEKAKWDGEEYWHLIPILTNKLARDKETVKAYSEILAVAAAFGQTEIVIHLLSVGADPNMLLVKSGPKIMMGWTALHFAFHHNDPTMALYLMAAGADPDLTLKVKDHQVPSFRQLAEGKNEAIDLFLGGSKEFRTGGHCLNYLQSFSTDFPIRKPRLPGPTGIAVVLLALAHLMLRIRLVFKSTSKKEFDTSTASKKDLKQNPQISPAANRFFEARARMKKQSAKESEPQLMHHSHSSIIASH